MLDTDCRAPLAMTNFMSRKISATMVSQHPDHAAKPYWHSEEFISTQHETYEAFLAFSEEGANEYKWDWEGKFVDESVIERLLSTYFEYFKAHPLGHEKFLTFRLPNPKVETEFRIGRAFMGILSADMLAREVGLYSPPLFEVILPMTETAEEMIDIQEAFREMAQLKHKLYRFEEKSLRHIALIPLFEDIDTIANSDKILEKYLKLHNKKFKFTPAYLRPYVARSDPALNAGLVPTVLSIKIAFSKYREFEKKHGIPLYPIIGSASLPFRGGITPYTVKSFANEYKGVRTTLLQSGFRYDYDKLAVKDAIALLEELLPQQKAQLVSPKDEVILREVMASFAGFYRSTVEELAEKINTVATSLPRRRERVQHVGLFGYSRGVGKVKLPRAIGFTASLYSLGIPPEIIGTGRGLAKAKTLGQLPVIEKYYLNLRSDLLRAGRFVNKTNLNRIIKTDPSWNVLLEDIAGIEAYLGEELVPLTSEEQEHQKVTTQIVKRLDRGDTIAKLILDAALLRKSLG